MLEVGKMDEQLLLLCSKIITIDAFSELMLQGSDSFREENN